MEVIFCPPNPPNLIEEDEITWIPMIGGTSRVPIKTHKWKAKKTLEEAHFTILYSGEFNVDMGTMNTWVEILKETLQCNVITFDYPGYGRHEGSPSEKAFNDTVVSVFTYMIETLEITPKRIILFGHGFGSGPIIHLAASTRDPESKKRESISRSLSNLMRSPVLLHSLPHEPPAGIVLLNPIASVIRHFKYLGANVPSIGVSDLFVNQNKIDLIKCHLLVVASINDPTYPVKNARKLASKAMKVWRFVEIQDLEEDEDVFLEAFLDFRDMLSPVSMSRKFSRFVAPSDSAFSQSPTLIITKWLAGFGLDSYATMFLANGFFDMKVIATLDDIDIEGMGISDISDRRKILLEIEKLKGEGSNPGVSNPVPIEKKRPQLESSQSSASSRNSYLNDSCSSVDDNMDSKSEANSESELIQKISGSLDFSGIQLRHSMDQMLSPHNFVLTQFTHPVWCKFCCKFVYGLFNQGYSCKGIFSSRNQVEIKLRILS
eukprot:TRINITY_DN4627_c0_g2_i4.p1 TRINITY_DN4627_c0_g2~~TRINITY_DN4627_c0_g2_i4.p1  ORF type:complete len:489 (-),score=135.40 TRINITY_DN4627_c0_g2_i4:54-1520(-)